MDEVDTLLVIARKFNDIFYAISTSEWTRFKRRVLVIFANNGFSEQFPFQEMFDDVLVLGSTENRKNSIHIIRDIRRVKKRIRCDAVMVSNVVLVVNQYLMKISGGRQIFLLEDGLMNYYDFHPSTSRLKYITQLFLGINERKLFNRITETFLLVPGMARYYGGKLAQLQLKPLIMPIWEKLDIVDKKIFVGQCVYKFGYMSLEEYNRRVNQIIKKYDIDYYLPHAFASEEEQIDCPVLDLSKLHITLEVLASQFNFELYSFCSSVLYTTRVINSNVKSYLVHIPELTEKSKLPVIEKYCSKIIDI